MSDSKEIIKVILQRVQNNEITQQEASSMIDNLITEEKFKITYKVSEKGAISFYNIRKKLPITLYKLELDTIIDVMNTNEFKQFLKENYSKLK